MTNPIIIFLNESFFNYDIYIYINHYQIILLVSWKVRFSKDNAILVNIYV